MVDRTRDEARGPEGPGPGGGLSGAELARREKDALAGTGGSSGGGTIAGAGDVSGGATDREKDPTAEGSGDAGDALGEGKLAAARGRAPTIGEALGTDAGGPAIGSGTKPDKGDLGGGGRGAPR